MDNLFSETDKNEVNVERNVSYDTESSHNLFNIPVVKQKECTTSWFGSLQHVMRKEIILPFNGEGTTDMIT